MTILIWGSTWLAITFQLGQVDPMVSVAYRFSLASVLLLIWCKARKLPMRFTAGEHLAMATQGVFLFGINYWLFYLAELHIASGLAAVIFSTVMMMNVINGALFLKSPMDMKVIMGGLLGLIGIGLVFRPELTSFHWGESGTKGLLICFAATYLASIGNILSARNQKKGLSVVQTNAIGMMYGALLMLGLSWLLGRSFTVEMTGAYLGSLIYLAVFGSIIAFGCYLSLVGSIGADRAAYTTLVFPVVALIISTIWEGYQWSGSAFCGLAFILLGNLLLLKRRTTPPTDRKTCDPLSECPEKVAV